MHREAQGVRQRRRRRCGWRRRRGWSGGRRRGWRRRCSRSTCRKCGKPINVGRRMLQSTLTHLHSSPAASQPPSGPCQLWRRQNAVATHSAPSRCSFGVEDARGTCPPWCRCPKRRRPQQGQWRRPVRPCARPEHGARDIRRGRGRGSGKWRGRGRGKGKCVGSPSRHRR